MAMYNRAFRNAILILSAIFLIILNINVFAQQTTDHDRKHPLWKISTKSNTIYFLGSVHVLKKDAYPLDRIIEKAYMNSQRLFFELNLDEANALKLQQLTADKGFYDDGRTIKANLSTETYDLVKKHLAESGMNIENFERFKPWLLAMTIEISELKRLGFDPSLGLDKYFYEKAKKDKKNIYGFETAEYQLSLLADMPDRMQEEMLLQTMKDIDEGEKELNMIFEAWKTGNAEALDTDLLKSFQNFPEVYKRLIADRNNNWIPKIESLIGQKENAMVIVGTAHLVGKDGILSILRQKGYQVEQL
jgi:uncharacterized protein YbaP (TraB family)